MLWGAGKFRWYFLRFSRAFSFVIVSVIFGGDYFVYFFFDWEDSI